MYIQMVAFSEPKAGNTPTEWEDGASGGVVGAASKKGQSPAEARFIVADGATEAYDSQRWVDQLVSSFAPLSGGVSGPRLEVADISAWFGLMQARWAADSPQDFDSIIEERKFKEEGSFATLLGFELAGLNGLTPSWRAIALGDTVLFHVRSNKLLVAFPPLGPDDFGSRPDGVHTKRSELDRMTARLQISQGAIAADDFLFAATDALAHWILRMIARGAEPAIWHVLSTLSHPSLFARLVADQRRARDKARRMKNDDVTLVRVRILANQPDCLLVCR